MTLVGLNLFAAHAGRVPRALPHLKALAAFIAETEAETAAGLAAALPGLVSDRAGNAITLALPGARVTLAVNTAIPAARVVAVEDAR